VIDINGNDYMDTEIGLLLENPATNALFKINDQYATFESNRKSQAISGNQIVNGDPSLVDYAAGKFGDATYAGVSFRELIKMNSLELKNLESDKGKAVLFGDLDEALVAAGKPAPKVAAAIPQNRSQALSNHGQKSVSTTDLAAAPMPPSGSGAQQPSGNLAKQIGSLDPQKIAALEVLLGNR